MLWGHETVHYSYIINYKGILVSFFFLLTSYLKNFNFKPIEMLNSPATLCWLLIFCFIHICVCVYTEKEIYIYCVYIYVCNEPFASNFQTLG